MYFNTCTERTNTNDLMLGIEYKYRIAVKILRASDRCLGNADVKMKLDIHVITAQICQCKMECSLCTA